MTVSGHADDRSAAVPRATRARAARQETVRVTEACTACGACLATCPERALVRAPKRPEVVDSACTACWACIEICPVGALVEVGTHRPALQFVRRAEVRA